MKEERDPRDNSPENKWNYIFEIRRKNKEIDRYYTLYYYTNQYRTKILEAGNNRIIIHTCPIFIDQIISCYFHHKYYNYLDSLKLLDVINYSFNNYCTQCDHWKDNKCPHWEDWVNRKPIVDIDGEPIKIKEYNSFYKLYDINNDQSETI
jgi:hypothetical protein